MLVESGCRVRLLNFSTDAGNARLGFKIGDRIFDAHRAAARQDFSQSALNSLPGSVDDYLRAPLAQQDQLRELIAAGEESGSSSDGVYTDDEVTFHPPVLRPRKVLAAGRNFRSHLNESKGKYATDAAKTLARGGQPTPREPEVPTEFVKVSSSLIGHASRSECRVGSKRLITKANWRL